MKDLIARLAAEPMTRIVALGASATERGPHSEGCHNWVGWLDVGLREHFGRVHHVINVGVSGDTTRGMLERFQRDVAHYRPHLVIISAGGNDCNPVNGISADEFADNLRELIRGAREISECEALLQTYYAFDAEAMPDEAERARQFPIYMEAVRRAGAAEGVEVVDHLPRWERLQQKAPEVYRRLMRDAMHLNPLGNMVFGLDLLRWLGAPICGESAARCSKGIAIQQQMDAIA